jgi:hypothetical protein
MANNFVVFIITHGRPDKILTLNSLKKCAYSGDWYLILDNEDATIHKYQKKYGEHKVIVFDKKAMADLVDEGNNFDNRRTTTHARNACFNIAKKLNKEYFLVLDDDYTGFSFRYERGPYIKNINKVFDTFIEFMKNIPNCLSIAFSQGGDHIGGFAGTKLKRKAMNSFFCSVNRPYQFLGQLNEDVNAYVTIGSRGGLFFTFTSVQLNQAATQKTSGGMTDAYLQYGTFCKSFTTVMMMPSSVKVSMMVTTNQRLHHSISWVNTVPMIIPERYKKINLGTEVSEQIKTMETKNNSGSLFKQKKDKPTQPDYTGTASIDGKQFRMSGWVNTSKSGMNYLRILFSEQQMQDLNTLSVQDQVPLTPQASQGEDQTDDLPF